MVPGERKFNTGCVPVDLVGVNDRLEHTPVVNVCRMNMQEKTLMKSTQGT